MKQRVLSILILLFAFWGCEEKATPVDTPPAEAPEETHERGYIDTH